MEFEQWKKELCIVRGGGDIATGTIYKMFQCGFPLLVLEIDNPSCIRRTISFCEAVFDDGVEIVDYKTDHVRDGEILREKYRRQLLLYRAALEKKLSLPVKKCTIYSLHLSKEIDVPIA